MKAKFFNLLIAASVIAVASCNKPNDGPVTPPEPEPVAPVKGFVTIVNEDGSVLVESDYANNTVNNLITAIKNYAGYDGLTVQVVDPETGEVTETEKTVKCNNVFYLQRDGIYLIEGKGKINSSKDITDEEGNVLSTITVDAVKIAAEEGDGAQPVIQPIADQQGATVADMMIFETSAEIEDVYFSAVDPMTNSIMQRMLRMEAKKGKLVLRNCFADYSANCFFRIEAKNTSVEVHNSTFRNLAKGFSSNGRLVDTRGNDMQSIIIDNCIVYNMVGRAIRYDKATIKELILRNNTFYNCGYGMQIERPQAVTVENNIFADNGWYISANAYSTNDDGSFKVDEAGNKILNNDFWDITGYTSTDADGNVTVAEDLTGVNVVIRNNNIFTSSSLAALYDKYENAHAPVWELGAPEKALVAAKVVKFENNFEEVLAFDNAPALPLAFIEERLRDITTAETVREDFCANGSFSFNYPSSAKSSTAAVDGGKLGAR